MPEDAEKYPAGTMLPTSEWTVERMRRSKYAVAGTVDQVKAEIDALNRATPSGNTPALTNSRIVNNRRTWSKRSPDTAALPTEPVRARSLTPSLQRPRISDCGRRLLRGHADYWTGVGRGRGGLGRRLTLFGADRFFVDDFARDVRYGVQIDRRACIDTPAGASHGTRTFCAHARQRGRNRHRNDGRDPSAHSNLSQEWMTASPINLCRS
jgi:hypothetical protein